MTKTKKELIEKINRITGTDRTAELSEVPKYKLCVMIDEMNDREDREDREDLVNLIGSSIRF